MEQLQESTITFSQQIIRFIQIVGIPLFGFLLLIGLIILLTSGKNPHRKRKGFVMTIVSGIGVLAISYVPVLSYYWGQKRSENVTGNETIESMVDSSRSIGSFLFESIQKGSIPILFTVFYIGLIILLTAAKSPQKKRLGIGTMIFSPIVLGVVFIMPQLLSLL